MAEQGRKAKHEIRHRIIENLEQYPHTAAQLSSRINSGQQVVQTHLEHLEELGVVFSFQKEKLGGSRTYWRLNTE